MYDLARIKDDLSCIEATSELGIKMQKRGANYSILCPAHNDRHFGSCFVKEKSWTCYACGAGGDVFSLIEAAEGVSKGESYERAAQMTGRPEKYRLDDERYNAYVEQQEAFPLTNEDIELLGLKKSGTIYNLTNISDVREPDSIARGRDENENVVYYSGTKEKFSLYQLWNEDNEAFQYMISEKAREKKADIEKVLAGNLMVNLKLSAEIIYEVSLYLKRMLIQCDLIIKKINM